MLLEQCTKGKSATGKIHLQETEFGRMRMWDVKHNEWKCRKGGEDISGGREGPEARGQAGPWVKC